ncbi:maleylpyruvate isomerase N-terminal domain-containing protein [Actinoplanes sp. NPDC051851]|uniref:maleylpyruvate isomerase N-terminal domain-containing protein n=1 Tax=Actinoplanes sp. NPDC051851 TaxID=3154753 RepID=UPI0034326CAF
MTQHLKDPATDLAPSDDAMLTAYLDSARRIITLAREVGETAAPEPVPACPAWTIRDLLAHVTSVGRLTSSGTGFGDDPQKTVDREVSARRQTSLAGIADEFESVLPTVEARFAGRSVGPLVVDLVSHEHDLRTALGPAYRDHEAGLPEALSAMVAWVRYLDLVGERGLLLRTPEVAALFGGPQVAAEVDLPDAWELFRLLGVRRSADQLRAYRQNGDGSLLFDVTSRYPLPEKPLETDG